MPSPQAKTSVTRKAVVEVYRSHMNVFDIEGAELCEGAFKRHFTTLGIRPGETAKVRITMKRITKPWTDSDKGIWR